ncbi:hypothetical protein [Asticcacaulis benevestitus]|uniref:DUF2946 domain-containing protein n=1 Tax=Asticcacaulis benevestitus DSM 16100 = ATCC BAA-896 TaxID=1121022 RepID=V4RD33_9CAUL|nr:hypothetical protein [Asticcacaulis benevestitus]ESQ89313.1 hypothetical protein ABENE_14085 [Asticcacaulis benevestitus DSM 16100 = ATCC BAA-896]
MKHLRVLLAGMWACVWLLFSLTATSAMPAMAEDAAPMPCHMESMAGMDMDHKPATPSPQSVMPCCSQPTLPAVAEAIALLSRPFVSARLTPEPAAPLINLPARLEPRPPKIA